jgi:hypothetical protein
MHTPFNPYTEWLGLTDRARPADYYELLGLDPQESDPEAIATAAKHLAARVRSIRPGPRLAEWQALLDEINEAKTCLLDPEAKATYDKTLGGQATGYEHPDSPFPNGRIAPSGYPLEANPPQSGPGDPSPSMPGDLPAAAVEAPGTEAVPTSQEADLPADIPSELPATRAGSGKRRFPWQTLIGLIAVALVFALAIPIGYRFLHRPLKQSQEDAETAADEPSSGTSATVAPQLSGATNIGADTSKPVAAKGGQVETLREPPEVSASPPENATTAQAQPSDPVVDAQQQVAFRKAVADVRTSLGERDPETAATHLATATTYAQTAEEETELARLHVLKDHLEEFLRGIRQCVSRLQGGEEFELGDTIVVVVEAREDLLIVRAEGRNYRYAIRHIPHRLILALADQWYANRPSSRVLIGTYHALDQDGDRQQARLLWQQAAIEGFDVEDLMPELARSRGPERGGADVDSAQSDEEILTEERDKVRRLFQAEYDAATDPAGQSALAQKLIASQSQENSPTTRQAMLTEAREMATIAGKAALAIRAIDALDRTATESLDLKTSTLVQVSENARGASSQRELAQVSLQLIPTLIEANRLEDARRLTELADTAAREAGNTTLLRRARTIQQQLEARGQRE